jgi:WD40 repeat protein
MANEPSTIAYDPEERLHEAIAAFEQARDDGRNPDPAAWLDDYPDVADRLAGYFADQNGLKRLAAPLHPASPVSSLPHPFGAYELLEEIGRGGMGVVYRACQVPLQRSVALKMILAGQLASPAEVRRFRTEAENAARLDHPHIVPIHEVGEQDGQHYFSMKLIEGTNLGQQLEHFTSDPQAAARLMGVMARAVHHAHQRGILHRDLKPGNILLDAQGQPHVTDFGLAKRVEGDTALTQSGAIVGTPSYMAPEQASGAEVLTTQADVYGLGAVLYELLTGRPPFKAGNVLDTLIQVRQQEPVRPRVLNAQVDRDLETICLTCLEKEPQRRYGSAEALAEDLERWLAGEPIRVRPCGAWGRLGRWTRRKPAVAALTAVCFFLAVIGVSLVTWKWVEAEESRTAVLAKAKAAEDARKDALEAANVAEQRRVEAEQALNRARRGLYGHQFAQAALERAAGRYSEAERLLCSCPWDLCGWEWQYLSRASRTGRTSLPLRGHQQPIGCLAFNSDSTLLVSGETLLEDQAKQGKRAHLKVWDIDTWQERFTVPAQGSNVLAVAFSADGRDVLALSGNGQLEVWDAQRGTAKATFQVSRSPLTAAVFNHTATRIAGRDNEGVGVWELRHEQVVLLRKIKDSKFSRLALSPDGQYLALERHGAVALLEVATGGEIAVFRGHRQGLEDLKFSADGRCLASADMLRVKLWDVAAQRLLLTLQLPESREGIISVAFTPDGERLVAGIDEGLVMWDTRTGVELLTEPQACWVVGFSPNGRHLVGADGRTLRLWSLPEAPEPFRLREAGAFPLTFSADGRLVSLTPYDSASPVTVWDRATGQLVSSVDTRDLMPRIAALSPDGRQFALAASDKLSRKIHVLDVKSGKTLRTFQADLDWDDQLRFSPDGMRFVSFRCMACRTWKPG